MRLLVVEDDVKLVRALQRGLQREGYAVDLAQSGDEAPADEEPVEMTLKSVETVSAIDLVMGGAPEEDDSSQPETA